MIVECNGLPGCGKTTLVEEVSKKLSDMGILHTVAGVNAFRYGNKIKRVVSLLNYSIVWTALSSRKGTESLSFLSFKERLITLMYLHYLITEYDRARCLIVSDEGIVQTLATVSSFTDTETKDTKAAKNLLRSERVLELNCDLSIHDSIKRIADRQRHDSAIDSMQGDALAGYLSQHSERLQSLRRICTNSYELDMKRNVRDLVAEVSKILEENI